MRLILLNGPPAIGKSTLAQRYRNEHAGTEVLDLDQLRATVPNWRDDPDAAGLQVRELALHGAGERLRAGDDVIVPQYLGRTVFIEQLAGLAAETGADFVEVMLLGTVEQARQAFAARAGSAVPEHQDASWLVEQAGPDELDRMFERLRTVLSARPGTRIVRPVSGDVEATYRRLLVVLAP